MKPMDGMDVMIAAIRHDTLINLRRMGATEIELDDSGNVKRVVFGTIAKHVRLDGQQNKA